MPLAVGYIIGNRILRALPQADFAHIRPHLLQLPLRQKQILREAGAAIEHVHFIEEGLASVLTITAEGDAVEVRMAVTGFSHLLGAGAVIASADHRAGSGKRIADERRRVSHRVRSE